MLAEITIPDGTSTGAGSHRLFDKEFSFCTSLRAIHLPATTASISSSAFSACTSLEEIKVAPDSTTFASVQGVLFTADMGTLIRCPAGFSGVLDIPASTLSINASAFDDCTGVSGIRVDPSNPNFSDIDGVLYNKDQTQLIRCPGGYIGSHDIGVGVGTIQNGAFGGCPTLTAINVHQDNAGFNSVDGVLYDKDLKTLIQVTGGHTGILSIPDSVTAINSGSIASCSLLTSIFVGIQNPSFTSVQGVLYNKDQTTLIACPSGYAGGHAIPDSVMTVTEAAFKDCTELTSVVLPTGLTSIDAFTFMGCTSLESVTVPESVRDIGVYSFFACSKLEKLTFLGDPPQGEWFWQSHYNTGTGGASVFHYENASWVGTGTWQGFPLASMGTRSGFKDWLIQRGMAHDSDPELDENMDGVGLLMAYALDLNPELHLAGSMPKAEITPDDLKIRFSGNRPDIVYVVKTSSDLVHWDTNGVSLGNPDINGMREAAVKRETPRQFLKLLVRSGE
ncbi:MAG TPA: leucine-rich repeat domain-containing protein, partial [Luteolibacter sp.]|nr:leucine-rich repeat domain-containing protein [Luteolibacter sp.]